MSQNPLEFVDDADDTDFVFKVQNGEEEDQQEDGDGQVR